MILHNIDDSREFDICEDVISSLGTCVDSAVHVCVRFAFGFEGGLRSFALRSFAVCFAFVCCLRLCLSLLQYYKNRNHFS